MLGESIPNPLGVGKERGWGALLSSRVEKLVKNSSPGPGKMLTQLLVQDVFGAAKPQEAGLAADCAGFERGKPGKPGPVSLSSPLRSPEKLLLFPGVILGDFSLVQPGLGSLQSQEISSP